MSLANSENLLDLAKSRAPADRERLLLALAELCDARQDTQAMSHPEVQALLTSIFMSLVVEAERDIRKRLAEKLAHVDWAPSALINVLALDEIEIARPVIAASPVLKDQDLVHLLIEATIEHQIEVARRPQLGAAVVAAIMRLNEPAVLTALAGNATAEVGEPDLERLVQTARRVAALRTPLSQHPKLSAELALTLYAWVGEAMRRSLVERFRIDSNRLQAVLLSAVNDAYAGARAGGGDALVVARDGEREMMESRLIDKLHAAGQLRPGYLVRALREGRLTLFITALAMLGRFEVDHIKRAINSDRPELLALACAAVGIDRSVFPTILEMVRDLNEGRPSGGRDGAQRAAGAFGPFTPQVAGAAFRQAALAS